MDTTILKIVSPSGARNVACMISVMVFCSAPFSASAADAGTGAPADADSIEFVMHLASLGEYDAAVALFERVKQERPETIESIHGHKVAVIYAVLGNRSAHKVHCRWLMARYRDAKQPTDAERSVKGYLLFPSTDDPSMLGRALERTTFATDRAKERGEGEYILWFEGARGMAEYRVGNYEAAVTHLETSANAEDIYIASLALPFQAMAESALGHHERAKALLEQARAMVARLPEPGTDEYLKEWTDTLTSQIALREAEQVILGQADKTVPGE